MIKPKLAVCVDDLRQDVKATLSRARELEFNAVDLAAVRGPVSPGELSRTGQRHLMRHLADLGLRLASLRGPVGGPGYADSVMGERRLDTMRGVIALAAALRVPVVSTTLGTAAGTADDADANRLREALAVLADDADRAGVGVAVETAGVGAAALQGLLADVSCPALGSCCDSGAMIMQGDDPHAVEQTLPGRILLVRARDAVRGAAGSTGCEVAQGDGQLDIPRFLAALMEAGFQRDIVLTRTTGSNPASDLLQARREFEKHLG